MATPPPRRRGRRAGPRPRGPNGVPQRAHPDWSTPPHTAPPEGRSPVAMTATAVQDGRSPLRCHPKSSDAARTREHPIGPAGRAATRGAGFTTACPSRSVRSRTSRVRRPRSCRPSRTRSLWARCEREQAHRRDVVLSRPPPRNSSVHRNRSSTQDRLAGSGRDGQQRPSRPCRASPGRWTATAATGGHRPPPRAAATPVPERRRGAGNVCLTVRGGCSWGRRTAQSLARPSRLPKCRRSPRPPRALASRPWHCRCSSSVR